MGVNLMFIRLSSLLLALMVFTGCAPSYLYHSPQSNCSAKHSSSCSQSYIENDNDYTLGFIEIDDKGWFKDRQQLNAFIHEIQQTGDQDILLLVYAHGWKHNADNNDRDVIRMRSTLKHLVAYENQTSHPRKVIGLYIGWRGLSVNTPIIKEFSFWERKATAHNAGETANEIFTRLQLLMDNKRKHENSQSSYVVVGHSFGGALVYSAMRPIMVSRLSRDIQTPQNKKLYNNDLVVLLNPAFEAARVKELRDLANGIESAPYLIILTADNDNATKKAFPAGRFFSTMFSKYSNDQKKSDRTTIGHYRPFFTHELLDIGETKGHGCGQQDEDYVPEADLAADNKLVSQWLDLYPQSNHQLPLADSHINHVSTEINPNNPLQVIYVKDRDILDKHSNIICGDLVDLIRTYILFNARY